VQSPALSLCSLGFDFPLPLDKNDLPTWKFIIIVSFGGLWVWGIGEGVGRIGEKVNEVLISEVTARGLFQAVRLGKARFMPSAINCRQ